MEGRGEMTKSRALNALGRKKEARTAYEKAVGLGNQSQVHDFGRTLQTQGHQDEAMELFRSNIMKDPNSSIGHNEAARVAVAKGDYTTALALKTQHFDLVRRLENKEDINR